RSLRSSPPTTHASPSRLPFPTPATPSSSTLSLHDALPISSEVRRMFLLDRLPCYESGNIVMNDLTDPLVIVEQRGQARLLTLNRPHVRNALSKGLSDALIKELHSADHDLGTRVILLAGAGGAFCSGVDLRDLAERGFDGGDSGGENCITRLAAVRTPVIGLVSGPAVTGGFELALACDFLIAAPDARFAD